MKLIIATMALLALILVFGLSFMHPTTAYQSCVEQAQQNYWYAKSKYCGYFMEEGTCDLASRSVDLSTNVESSLKTDLASCKTH